MQTKTVDEILAAMRLTLETMREHLDAITRDIHDEMQKIERELREIEASKNGSNQTGDLSRPIDD